MNKHILMGRLVRDPELRRTEKGNAVVTFTLAVGSDRNNDLEFFKCQAWNKQAEVIEQYVHKGDLFLVSGEHRTNKYQNKDGVNVTDHYINVREFEFGGKKESKVETDFKQEKERKNEAFDTFDDSYDIMDNDIQF